MSSSWATLLPYHLMSHPPRLLPATASSVGSGNAPLPGNSAAGRSPEQFSAKVISRSPLPTLIVRIMKSPETPIAQPLHTVVRHIPSMAGTLQASEHRRAKLLDPYG